MSDSTRDNAATDGELVARAQAGDERAVELLVSRHLDGVFRVAVSITRDDDVAQDVVQEAFLKMVRAIDSFRGDASFKTWLMTIAANEARGALRKSTRRRESPIDERSPLPARGRDIDQAVVDRSESERARQVLETLPEKQRLSVALRIDEGLSFREIGDVIGSSEGAARVNYFHGIRRLRELME